MPVNSFFPNDLLIALDVEEYGRFLLGFSPFDRFFSCSMLLYFVTLNDRIHHCMDTSDRRGGLVSGFVGK